MNWKKYVFYWEKINFETIANSVDTTELLPLGQAFNKNINYLISKKATRQMKTLQVQSYIQNNDFMKNKELNLCKF